MIKHLYTSGGWVNIPAVRAYQEQQALPFCFCWGGRGIGKTYGALTDARQRSLDDPTGRKKFILVRRTQSQIDIIGKQDLSPFKRIDLDNGFFTESRPISKFTTGFYSDGVLLGYAAALSTFSNLRGFDASDVDNIVFDEFIPEQHEKPIREEAEALLNLYETINRNRELDGAPPVRMACYANSNRIDNAIFTGLGLVNVVEKMQKKHREQWEIRERGILLLSLDNSPVSQAKAETALYKLSGKGSQFSRMALGNDFRAETGSRHGSRNIAEYSPVVRIGAYCVYEHKSTGEFYICSIVSGSPETYGTSAVELQRFKAAHIWLWREYMAGNIVFRDLETEIEFRRWFGA